MLQHTTPKCYLKKFSDDGKLIFRKFKSNILDEESIIEELSLPISLKKEAAVEKDFYTVNKGRNPLLVETLIYDREIETHYNDIYKLLINPSSENFNPKERIYICMCLLSLHCRTPKQFSLFYEFIENKLEIKYETETIHEDYKVRHLRDILPNFIAAHQFKIVRIATIQDNSEFITSDNPVLIVDDFGNLMNGQFREQFNIDNKIIIPLDKKNCCIFTNATDKNGVSLYNKVFYNKIERTSVDFNFAFKVNSLMWGSADKFLFGSQSFMKEYFTLFSRQKNQ